MTNIKPKKLMMLSDPKRIKAYVHPTRITILRMLAAKKMTISNVARKLKVHPANITHHFKLLEKVRLIVLVEKRDIGQNIEKYYRSVAHKFLVNFDKPGKISKKVLALSILRDDLSSGISTIRRQEKQEIIALIKAAKILPEDIKPLQNKIMKLIKEFAQLHSAKGMAYTMNISVYPTETEFLGHEEIIIDE